MNTASNFTTMFPSSSFGFNGNHQEFNEDSTTTTTRASSSTLLDTNSFKNNHFPSMIVIDKQSDESSNQGEDEFHRKSSFLF
jgi:hypothetical protein